MKKLIVFLTFSTIVTLIAFSCSKSIDPETQIPNPANIDKAELIIRDFLMEDRDPLKVEKVYSTDSAIWYTEAALNFTYAIYDSSFMYIMIDTSDFSFELDQNQQVTQTELESVYDEMVDVLGEYFDELQESTKHLFFCDVEEKGIDGNYLNVTLYTVIACGYSGYQWSSFDEEDYWYSILEWGKCNGYQGTGDAAIMLTAAFMSPMVAFDPQVRIWFSDEVTIPEVNPWYYNYSQAPRGKRGFYYEGTGQMQNPQCLDPDEMEFYMSENGIPFIINDQNPDPNDLDLASIQVIGDLSPGYNYIEVHFLTITYGVEHHTSIPASGL
jgi:hypothetical protein